ncbi:MAG TPA: radical SAM protein [Planctomycetota bacterium]|nr:radical SAM protein [Planctomycetota bacterium]
MKVVLVNPFQVRRVARKGRIYNRTWTPLDLATTAAVLREQGHDVAIVDANAEQLTAEQTAARARGFDQAYLTSTSLDRWQCPYLDLDPFVDHVKAVAAVVPEIFVMGSHGTVRPAEMLALTGAKAVLRGEPEGTVPELAARRPLADVAGITWAGPDGAVHNPDRKLLKLDALPMPAFDLLPMHLYSYEVMGRNFCLFEMSRGCASDCTFCLLEQYGDGVRRKSVSRLAAEIETAVMRYGVRKAYFIDLEFTVLRKQAMELCDWLIAKNYDFEWCCQTRFDLVDDELLAKMQAAKCTLIHFGVEAGSDAMLARVEKGITMAGIREGMAKVKKTGIRTACFLMIGFPESTPQDMDDILSFARELKPDYPLFHIAAPYPGTRMYEQVRAEQEKPSPEARFSDASLFPEAVENRHFKLHDLKRITRQAYLRYYTRPTYLASRLVKGDFGNLLHQARLFWQFVTA